MIDASDDEPLPLLQPKRQRQSLYLRGGGNGDLPQKVKLEVMIESADPRQRAPAIAAAAAPIPGPRSAPVRIYRSSRPEKRPYEPNSVETRVQRVTAASFADKAEEMLTIDVEGMFGYSIGHIPPFPGPPGGPYRKISY